MAQINLLSKDISELIAAGEVIERPASVIKELLENSIDAGAKHITVEIKNGGTTYMRITDDGCGIASEQVATAFLRHATSKISSKDDLDNILTLGFRGEALASVCAVAKVEVLTKTVSEELGTNYIIEGGTEKLNDRTGCPDGTTIIIRDIFYNVPVRQKFMKKDSAEASAISGIMQKIVLSHPDISFKFIKDNKVEFASAGDGKLISAIYGVYGRDFAHDLIPVDYSENGVKVSGYILKPLYSKNNRSFQNFFINGRYVKSVTCRISLEEAFKNLVMQGKYPACVLMLEIPPATVDVNIHPAKAEVRFSDEKTVFDCLYFAVKNALLACGLIYEFDLKEEKKPESYYKTKPFEPEKFEQPKIEEQHEKAVIKPFISQKPVQEKKTSDVSVTQTKEVNEKPFSGRITPVSKSEYKAPANESEIAVSSSKSYYDSSVNIIVSNEEVEEDSPEENLDRFSYINKSSFEKPKEKPVETKPLKEEINVIGEIFKNYILAQAGDNMVIIDKHAAHERVIFERLKANCNATDSQMLINEPEILLSEREFGSLSDNKDKIEAMGFKIDFSNKPYAKIMGVPIILESLNIDEVIPEIAENFYLNKVNPQTHLLDDMLHDLACKAAIKANDKNSTQELQALADEIYNNENIRHCPHGRPVMFVLSKRDIEKQFRRIL